MAVEIGRSLPNLKITVGNDAPSMEEEIQESDDVSKINPEVQIEQTPNVQVIRKFVSPLERFRVYENKGGAFITGLDLSSEVVTKKLVDRAARFGLEDRPKNPITQAEINALYKSLNIDSENSKNKNIRLDALHVRGVEEMSTSDVIDYFKEYGPASVEWINDFSCNVVWLDEAGAARALLGLSRVLMVKKKNQIALKDDKFNKDVTLEENVCDKANEEEVIFMSDISSDEDEDDDKLIAFKHVREGNPTNTDNLSKNSDSEIPMEIEQDLSEEKPIVENAAVDVPVPPGHWRLGIPHTKAKAILLRFATKDDRKLPGAEKRSNYYQKYGNPNYGGLRGLISKTRKRKFNATKQRQVVEQLSTKGNSINLKISDDEHGVREIKSMRMRMHADDEEEKIKIRNAKKQRIMENNSRPRNVHDRLGLSKRPVRNDRLSQRLGHTRWFSDDHKQTDEEEEIPNIIDNFNVKSKVSRPSGSHEKLSRFNVWTRLAESMAQESEELETNDRSLPSEENDKVDLRSRLRSSPYERNLKTDIVEEVKGDLRSKLEKLRRHNEFTKHRSPLLIETDS